MQHKRHDTPDELKARGIDRVHVDFDAYLRFENWPELPVFIRDFSSHGFKCACPQTLTIGSRVILRLPGVGQFPATIAWQLGKEAGARFDSPLPVRTAMQILLAVVQPGDAGDKKGGAAKAPERARKAAG